MNNQPREELMETLAELCERYPDWRLGQLVANVAGWTNQDIWEVEDKQLLQAARKHLRPLGPLEALPSGRSKGNQ